MSECKLDHSYADVRKKLSEQSRFLPEALLSRLDQYISEQLDQATLNELFHLLKKYDLADDAARLKRNQAFQDMLSRSE